MAYDNKPNLNSNRFGQKGSDYLCLAGQNCIYSGGTISSNTGYKISGSTIFNTGGYLNTVQIGCNSVSSGIASVSVGASAHSIGITSIAIGCNAYACTNGGISLGAQSKTNGCYAVSIGYGSCAMYDDSISIGGNSISNNINSISIGNSSSSGLNGVAVGNSSYGANNSVAIGNMACAIGCLSVAIGAYAGSGQTCNNRLYIANNTARTLIYGEFDNRLVKINGNLDVTGLVSGATLKMNGIENFATAALYSLNGDGTGAYGTAVISYAGANRKLFKVGFDTGDAGLNIDYINSTSRFNYRFNQGDVNLDGNINACGANINGYTLITAPQGVSSLDIGTLNNDSSASYGFNAMGGDALDNRKILRAGVYEVSNGFTVDWRCSTSKFAYQFNMGIVTMTDVTILGKSSVAPSGVAGGIYFNTFDSHFYGYNGSEWKQLDNTE